MLQWIFNFNYEFSDFTPQEATNRQKKPKKSSIPSKNRKIIDDDEEDYEPTVDHESTNLIESTVFKKRKFNEVMSKSEFVNADNKILFCDNFKPKSMKDLLIHHKKIEEFK